ncbi:MAG: hypothetical protein Q7U10_12220, partial [Thermodesulfovibrionia bacterium]|nr:hypothetical protein [Thermodesulfovibrionia bacterium]
MVKGMRKPGVVSKVNRIRKPYSVTLNEKQTDRLKGILGKNGITFSAYIDSCVRATLTSGVGGGTKKGDEIFLVAVQPVINKAMGKRYAKEHPEQTAFL